MCTDVTSLVKLGWVEPSIWNKLSKLNFWDMNSMYVHFKYDCSQISFNIPSLQLCRVTFLGANVLTGVIINNTDRQHFKRKNLEHMLWYSKGVLTELFNYYKNDMSHLLLPLHSPHPALTTFYALRSNLTLHCCSCQALQNVHFLIWWLSWLPKMFDRVDCSIVKHIHVQIHCVYCAFYKQCSYQIIKWRKMFQMNSVHPSSTALHTYSLTRFSFL